MGKYPIFIGESIGNLLCFSFFGVPADRIVSSSSRRMKKNMEIVPIKPLEKVTRVWEDVPSGYD